MFIETAAGMAGSLSLYAACANGLNGGDMGLFTAATVLTPATLLTDLTEAAFTGYAREPLATYGSAFVTPDGLRAEMYAPVATFVCTGAAAPEDVIGYFILDTNGVLVGFEVFDTPQPMRVTGQTITVQMKFARKDQNF